MIGPNFETPSGRIRIKDAGLTTSNFTEHLEMHTDRSVSISGRVYLSVISHLTLACSISLALADYFWKGECFLTHLKKMYYFSANCRLVETPKCSFSGQHAANTDYVVGRTLIRDFQTQAKIEIRSVAAASFTWMASVSLSLCQLLRSVKHHQGRKKQLIFIVI